MNGIICIIKNQLEKIKYLKIDKKLILNWLPKIDNIDKLCKFFKKKT